MFFKRLQETGYIREESERSPERIPSGDPRTTHRIGSTEALKEYNYNICYLMRDQYTKITRAITEYIGRECKNRAEIKN